jgi:hypothetical protein
MQYANIHTPSPHNTSVINIGWDMLVNTLCAKFIYIDTSLWLVEILRMSGWMHSCHLLWRMRSANLLKSKDVGNLIKFPPRPTHLSRDGLHVTILRSMWDAQRLAVKPWTSTCLSYAAFRSLDGIIAVLPHKALLILLTLTNICPSSNNSTYCKWRKRGRLILRNIAHIMSSFHFTTLHFCWE